MNFYIGDSFAEIKPSDESAEIDDDLFVYICRISEKMTYNLGALCDIDPYNDVKIQKSEVVNLIQVGRCILENSLLSNYKCRYEGRTEGEQRIRETIQIAEKAITEKKGLISVGD